MAGCQSRPLCSFLSPRQVTMVSCVGLERVPDSRDCNPLGLDRDRRKSIRKGGAVLDGVLVCFCCFFLPGRRSFDATPASPLHWTPFHLSCFLRSCGRVKMGLSSAVTDGILMGLARAARAHLAPLGVLVHRREDERRRAGDCHRQRRGHSNRDPDDDCCHNRRAEPDTTAHRVQWGGIRRARSMDGGVNW